MSKASLRGKVEILPLDSVKPNGYNPNRVPEHIMESIRHGFRVDGWIVSQALLVWATDEHGKQQNMIIDGEHRWRAANDVGLKKGPMVLLHDLPEVEAKALTVKLNQKRGDWDSEALISLMSELNLEDPAWAALDFGFSTEDMDALVRLTADLGDDTSGAAEAGSRLSPVGPQAMDEEGIQQEVAGKKFEIVVECPDREQAIAVAEKCRGEGWAFREEFR